MKSTVGVSSIKMTQIYTGDSDGFLYLGMATKTPVMNEISEEIPFYEPSSPSLCETPIR